MAFDHSDFQAHNYKYLSILVLDSMEFIIQMARRARRIFAAILFCALIGYLSPEVYIILHRALETEISVTNVSQHDSGYLDCQKTMNVTFVKAVTGWFPPET